MQIQADTGQVGCVEVPRDGLIRPLEPFIRRGVFAFYDNLRDRVGAKVRRDRFRLRNSRASVRVAYHKTMISPNVKTNARVGVETW